MTARISLGAMALVVIASGCVSDEQKLTTVPSSPFGQPVRTQSASMKQAPPATQQVMMRVTQLGQKIVTANPRIKQRVAFLTIGSPEAEIFHRVQKNVAEIYITEGLVNQCKNDGELAAVLCQELGKIGSEQAALVKPATYLPERPPMMSPHVGNDIDGPLGGADQTNAMIMARYEKEQHDRQKPPPPPPPETLARTYMQSAGFDPTNLNTVTPLLRKADQNNSLEQLMTGKPG
jgi:hypothetical protein